MSNSEFKVPAEDVLETVRAGAFANLAPHREALTHLGVVPRVYPEGHRLHLVDREIDVPTDSILVFEDQMPGANFGHPCRYLFHSPDDGSLLRVEDASFPPEVANPGIAVEMFHTPRKVMVVKPHVYDAIKWSKIPRHSWLVDDNRYALLFTGQISNRRHVEDVEFAYRVLRHRYGFSAGNIYVLCYDGTIGAVDANAEEMATWVGDGSAYEMKVTASGTQANLESTLKEIGGRMDDESLLFVHTNNHGSTTGLCMDNSSVVTPEEWGTMLSGMPSFGRLIVTMEQCYSGAFLQPTLDQSKAALTSFASAVPADKVSWGAEHFDPWALAWFEAVNGVTVYGASLPHQPDTEADGRISAREAFSYSDSYDTATADDPQYGERPLGCGYNMHLSKPPTVADIIKEIATKYIEIDKVITKRPIPDPPPDWAASLIGSLSSAEALANRLNAVEEKREALAA
jgi:hypothetical protein